MHPYWLHKSEKVAMFCRSRAVICFLFDYLYCGIRLQILLLNTAVRREVYNLVGGLPQGVHEGEDEIFWTKLKICCNGFMYPQETTPTCVYKVSWIHGIIFCASCILIAGPFVVFNMQSYPGNHLDAEKLKFTKDPIEGQFYSKRNPSHHQETRSEIERSSFNSLYADLMQLRYAPHRQYPYMDFAQAIYRIGNKVMSTDVTLTQRIIELHLEYFPGNAQAWRDLSVIYKMQQRLDYSRAALMQSLELDPQCHHALVNYAFFPGDSC